jgi:phenylacetate-CoA ligase
VRFVSHRDAGGGLTWNAVESGTIGRYDDMIKIRGNNMWPSTVDGVVFAHTEVTEYAGRVYTSAEGKTEVEVRVGFTDHGIHLGADYRRRILEAIRDDIKERTNVGMTVKEVPRAELPEFKYKARRWVDERQQGYR